MNRCFLSRAAGSTGCAVVALMFLSLSGCGGDRAMPAASSADVAKQSLEKALNQWVAGKSPDTLAAESPKIIVNDFEWKEGRKLSKFELAGPAETVGLQIRYPVALDVDDGQGQFVRKEVSYSVSTSPVVSIMRDDL